MHDGGEILAISPPIWNALPRAEFAHAAGEHGMIISAWVLNHEGDTSSMPIYILLSKLTETGIGCIIEDPSCLRRTSMEIEKLGVKVLDQYATLGEYDFVHVIDAPDNETIARVSIELIAKGNLKPLTLPTISLNDFISRMSLDRRP